MKGVFEQLGIAFFGLLTTILVVLIGGGFAHLTGFDLAGISINFIPFGAIIFGGLAASGYYFGAIYTHNRATPSLLIFMVVVAGLAQILTLWFDYVSLRTGTQPIKDLVSFGEYVSYMLGHVTLSMHSKFFHKNIGDVGVFSYLLSARQFLGYLAGGFFVYFLLKSRKICPACDLYLKETRENRRTFPDEYSVQECLERIRLAPAPDLSREALLDDAGPTQQPMIGIFRITETCWGCPICDYRVATWVGSKYDGKSWDDLEGASVSLESPSNRIVERPNTIPQTIA